MADWTAKATVTDPWVHERFLDVVNMRRRPAEPKNARFCRRVARALREQRRHP